MISSMTLKQKDHFLITSLTWGVIVGADYYLVCTFYPLLLWSIRCELLFDEIN